MSNLHRRGFLQSLLLAGLAYSPFANGITRLLSATETLHSAKNSEVDPCSGQPYIVDLHCHPNMKNYLLNYQMWRHRFHFNTRGTNKYNMQVDLHNLKKGNVLGFLAAHHLPERGMVEQANANRKLLPILKAVLPLVAAKTEHGDESNYRQLTYMIDEFEEHVDKTNVKAGGNCIQIAKSYADFERIIQDGRIAVAQSIEGIHALGRGITADEYLDRLNFLADRGICLITLSHFFSNDVSYGVEGIEPNEKRKLQLYWKYDPKYDNRPLTETGKKVVWQMFKRGVVVDLTHMTPQGRSEVFGLHQAFLEQYGVNRPLVFTHTGVERVVVENKASLADFKYMAPNDAEVKYIAKTGGVIGVIGENFWLTGNDNHTSSTDTAKYKDGIGYMIDTIKAIRNITGNYSNISIGSDFDGFANAPADFRNPAYFRDFVEKLRQEIPDRCDINAITHGNAMRALKNGWGNRVW